jgi:uncharacterized membrane-anchored protein YitT (DUF2179 family)
LVNKRKIFWQYIIITLGASFVALGLDLFLVPNKFVAGGVSGIATIIFHIFNFPVGISMLVLNAILFIIAFRILGRTFGAKTIYCTIILSIFTDIFAIFLPSQGLTQNLVLAVLFGAFLCGTGMGLVFSAGASTGGTDIIAMILKKLLQIAPAWGLLIVDIIITLIAGYFFGKEVAMFSILAVIVNTFTINTVLEGVTSSIQVMIISEKYSEITDRLLEELGVGATLLRGEGAFEEIPTYIILTVLHTRRQFVRLKQIVSEEDEKAFLLVSHVKEVLGEGFKRLEEV